MATIAVDAPVMASSQPGGYRTYATNLITGLAEVDRENRYLLLIDRPVDWRARPNWTVKLLGRHGSIGFVWREQITAHRFAHHQQADVYHALGATGPVVSSLPLVLTLHDAIGFTEPLPPVVHLRRWAMRLYSRIVQRALVTRARAIITISNYSKQQIARRLNVPSERIVTIYGAPSRQFHEIDRNVAESTIRDKHGLERYVLALASAEPRKNIGHLLIAYAALPGATRSRHPLVLVCTHREAARRFGTLANSLGLNGDVRLLARVADHELALLYGAAAVFVYPSLEEGFGLPLVEAMACGTSVITSDASSIPEVAGQAALFVPAQEVEALTQAMARVVASPALQEELRAEGLARAGHFSWQKAARETVSVYRSVAEPRQSAAS